MTKESLGGQSDLFSPAIHNPLEGIRTIVSERSAAWCADRGVEPKDIADRYSQEFAAEIMAPPSIASILAKEADIDFRVVHVSTTWHFLGYDICGYDRPSWEEWPAVLTAAEDGAFASSFFVLNGKFLDSECVEGVDSLWELPVFHRQYFRYRFREELADTRVDL